MVRGKLQRILKEEASKRGLVERLKLGKGSERRTYIAAVARPRGNATIMEAWKIDSEDSKAYLVREISEEERTQLEKKYCHQRSGEFTIGSLKSQRIYDS